MDKRTKPSTFTNMRNFNLRYKDLETREDVSKKIHFHKKKASLINFYKPDSI